MSSYKKIGPVTVEVAPGRPAEGDKPGVSATYRNNAATDELPSTINGLSTMYDVFNQSALRYADKKCLGWRPIDANGIAGDYQYITYSQLKDQALAIASAISQSGVDPSSKVGIYSANNVEWMVCIRATDAISCTVVPIYDSLGEQAVEHIVKHSELEIAFVESNKLKNFAVVAPLIASQVHTLVYFGDGDIAILDSIKSTGIKVHSWSDFMSMGERKPARVVPPKPDHVACIMYTSGTTGTPKGVMITQQALVSGVSGALTMTEQSGIKLNPDDSVLSYMPLAHIFDRIIEELALTVGGSIGYWQGNVKKLMDDVTAFKPTLFIAVPRILERVCDTVEGKLAKGSTAARMAFNLAFASKLFMLRRGLPHWISGAGWDQVVFKPIQSALGGRVRFIVSGGAPLAPHVEDFCNVCMAPVLQGYGLTETCAASFVMLPDPRLAHTVGPPLTPTEFRLESVPELKYDATADPPKGEIVIRGPMVFAGYYKDEEKTKTEFDSDGFFHTGDIGMLTPEGCLKIIDRKKNIFKLAQGEYIAVEYLEGKFSRSESVEQIWVYGNSLESNLVAVVVAKPSFLSKFNGVADPAAKTAMIEELAKTGKEAKLKGFEMVKSLHLVEEHFTVENDLMTPSMKLKRPQLQKAYQKELDAMYVSLKKK